MRTVAARGATPSGNPHTPRLGVLLLSGGFDSPVAGHLMARQGLPLVGAHFSLEPITDDTAAVKSRKLALLLGIPSLYVMRVGEAFAEVARRCDRRFYFVLTKRLMVRLADGIADREGAEVLVTGENLGQVSSQTLASLRVIDAAARRPVVRPLIGFDKQEIVDRAKRIGTYEISKGPEICDLLGPPAPATQARLEQVLGEEAKLDVARLVASTLQGAAAERFMEDGSLAGPLGSQAVR
jgi:thiamine biosynthesis protein ThiI